MAGGDKVKVYRTEYTRMTYGQDDPMDVVICFDTTGSMSRFLVDVRKDIAKTMKRIFRKIRNVRVAIFVHGDYCDHEDSYVTEYEDFSNDEEKLREFVANINETGGGDTAECYELALKEVREKLSWRQDSQKALIMIGDAYPHEWKDYHESILDDYSEVANSAIDWRDEVEKLIQMDCHIYPFQYGEGDEEADAFWAALAYITYSHRIHLSGTENTLVLILAVVYKEKGAMFLEEYKNEVLNENIGEVPAELTIAFVRLEAAPGSQEAVGIVSDDTNTEWLIETVSERNKRKAEVVEEKTKYLIEEIGLPADQVDLHIDKTQLFEDKISPQTELAWSVAFTIISLILLWQLIGGVCASFLVIGGISLFIWLDTQDRKYKNKSKTE